MPTLVVPFRGPGAKSRLDARDDAARAALALAMLEDVVVACVQVGRTLVVAPERPPREVDVAGATHVADPGGGQAAAVAAALAAAVVAGTGPPFLVVNADLPCVTASDLLALAAAVPPAGLALAEAADGTTNALALADVALFGPLYGPGSAERFAALGPSRRVNTPNLMDDVDTVADLERLAPRLGPQTRTALAALRVDAAA